MLAGQDNMCIEGGTRRCQKCHSSVLLKGHVRFVTARVCLASQTRCLQVALAHVAMMLLAWLSGTPTTSTDLQGCSAGRPERATCSVSSYIKLPQLEV